MSAAIVGEPPRTVWMAVVMLDSVEQPLTGSYE